MFRIGNLINTRDTAKGPALAKVESHTPKIEAPDAVKSGEPFKVKVKVGPHPSTPEHHIAEVTIYFSKEGKPFNPVKVATITFEPGITEPEAEVVMKVDGPGAIHAVAYCNLHGLWEGTKEIKVE